MPIHNNDTPIDDIPQNSDTFFAFTKMSLFWEEDDFAKKLEMFFKSGNIPQEFWTKISILILESKPSMWNSLLPKIVTFPKIGTPFFASRKSNYNEWSQCLKFTKYQKIKAKISHYHYILIFYQLPKTKSDRSSTLQLFLQINNFLY